MRNRQVGLLLVILIVLTAILLGNHLLSGRVGQGSAPAKRAVVAPFRAAQAREGSGLLKRTKLAAFPVDSPEVRLRSPSIVNRQSAIGNPLAPFPALSSIQNPKSKIQNAYGRLPLSFEANHGQTDTRVRFLARGGGYTIFLTDDEAVLALRRSRPGQPSMSRFGKFGLPGRLGPFGPVDPRAGRWPSLAGDRKSLWPSLIPDLSQLVPGLNAGKGSVAAGLESQSPQVVRMRLEGGNAKGRVVGLEELPGRSNYILGKDPKEWRTSVPSYARVKFESVYPGVDLVYYGNQRQLEYDFVVAPGADPNQIKLSFAGADGMRVDAASGDLVLKVGDDEARIHKPAVHQPAVAAVYERRTRGPRPPKARLEGAFVVASNNEVAFRVAGYDPKRSLVIDPVLSYSTYLGGSGSPGDSGFGDDVGTGIAVDSSGNAYVTGWTWSANFPTVNSIYPNSAGEGFVAKLNAAGSALVYCTYLAFTDTAGVQAIAVDSSGNAYVTGAANTVPTAGDAFVAKLDAAGSGLSYLYYLGSGPGGGTTGQGIAVDSTGNAYVTGYTNSTDFPTTGSPIQGTCGTACSGGGYAAFVAKLNASGSALVYSTYLSGSSFTVGQGIAVDSSDSAYVTGYTASTDFPTVHAIQATYDGGGYAAFVAKLNAAGSRLVYSTYLGSPSTYSLYITRGRGIAVDSSSNAYVTGDTDSAEFLTANALQETLLGIQNAFVAKLNAAGSALIYSTYLGGSNEDRGYGIAADSSGNAYVTGYTASSDFPTANPIQATCGSGIGPNCGDYGNAFVAELNAAGSALVYSTFLGGSGQGVSWDFLIGDAGSAIAVDSAGSAYITGYTEDCGLENAEGQDVGCGAVDGYPAARPFPTVNPIQPSNAGKDDVFVAKILALHGPGVSLSTWSLVFGPQRRRTTSAPQTIILTSIGSEPLAIWAITTSFSFAHTDTCRRSVRAGTDCTISVTFTPDFIGRINGTLTIEDDAVNVRRRQRVDLSGTGVR